ncbi:MAG: hypothetical protein IPL65_19230 [Lewinellaceae bacterium]|nr:hypothetical protein [Lewinellaceae bacterium]
MLLPLPGIGMFIGRGFSLPLKVEHAEENAGHSGRTGGYPAISALVPGISYGLPGLECSRQHPWFRFHRRFHLWLTSTLLAFLWILWKAPIEENLGLGALLAIYAVVIMFWAVFKQNGTA